MPEETPELPISPQEVQIQAPLRSTVASGEGGKFLDKIKVHKFKILGGILGAFIFVGAVFGAYKLGQKQVKPGPQPTPTPEAVATPTLDLAVNWKTYTNTKYQYSLKYKPNDKLKTVSCAKYGDDKKSGDERFIFYDASVSTPDPDPLYQCITQGEDHIITLTVLENADDCQTTESWKGTKSTTTIGGITVSKCESVFVGQKLFPGPDETTTVSIPSNNQYITITQYDKEFPETFNQILSTFKFLPSTDSTGSPQAGSDRGE